MTRQTRSEVIAEAAELALRMTDLENSTLRNHLLHRRKEEFDEIDH